MSTDRQSAVIARCVAFLGCVVAAWSLGGLDLLRYIEAGLPREFAALSMTKFLLWAVGPLTIICLMFAFVVWVAAIVIYLFEGD